MAGIAQGFENRLAAPVADKTGLARTYSFNLDFWDKTQPQPTTADAELPDDFLTAVQHQLGMKLVKQTTQQDVLVVDSASKVPIEK